VVGEVALRALPQPRVDAGGRHAPGTDAERVRDRAGQRMAHAHLPRRPAPGRHAQVAAAVDGAAPVARKPCNDKVGRPSLDRPPEVELEARRPADHARVIVDLDCAPFSSRVGASRAPWRRRGKPPCQRRRLDMRARVAIAGATQRPQQGRVDEAAGQRRRAQRARDRGPQQRSGGHACARIRVQARQIAAGVKARQPAPDLGEHRRHVEPAVGVAHNPRKRAHRRKAVVEHARPGAPRRQPSAVSSPGAGAEEGVISAPYACSRSAICPGLVCVVIGGGGGDGGAVRADRRRRTNSPTPPAVAAAAAATVQRARAITIATLDVRGSLAQGENYVWASAAATVIDRALGAQTMTSSSVLGEVR
jgi:hypothetical protein